jgi:formyltetrahydrofolate deformylase
MIERLATLLVSCRDRKGIVASLAQMLYAYGANILDADQHTDAIAQMFFQRIRFDLSTMTTDRVALEHGISEVAERFGMTWHISYASKLPRVAILVSKLEHCLYDLLLRHRAGELRCDMAMVISNHPDLEGVAKHFGVPYHHLPVTADTRGEQERQIIETLGDVDLVVLARYMQILTPAVVDRFASRIINIHHSFLPAFVGASPYRQAYDKGVKLIGATAHYVTADLDQGPIIEQGVIRCTHGDTVEDLVRKGRDVETRTLGAAVRWHVDDRILVYAGKTVVFD